MTWRAVTALIAVGLCLVAAKLVSRQKYGRLLMRVGEGPSATKPILAAIIAVFYIVLPWVRPHVSCTATMEWVICLIALLVLFLTPPPPGSWSVFEKGVLCAEGPKAEFVRWAEIERLEWSGDTALLSRSSTLTGASTQSHSLEVPAHRRAELEGVLAIHVRQSR